MATTDMGPGTTEVHESAPVKDTAHSGRIGVVMGRQGPDLQLRPLHGGREWDARPEHVELLTRAGQLRARLAVVNDRSRVRAGRSR